MCFVWLSEQTAIISLYSINWLVFITETLGLLSGTDWTFKQNLSWSYTFGRVVAQAVIRRRLMAESRVQSQVSPHGICGGQGGTSITSVFPCSIIPPTLSKFVYLNTRTERRTRGRNQGTFQRRNVVSDVSETCNRKVNSLFVAFKVVNVTREVIVLFTRVLCWSLSLTT